MIRWMTLFDNPCPEDVDEMAGAAWIKACGLSKFDNSVSKQPALQHVAYASPLDFFRTNVNHQPQTRGFYYSVRSTAVSEIGIKLQEIYELLETETPKKKGKVRWLLENERYIFENINVERGIIRPLVEIMLIFVLRRARSQTLAATVPPPCITVFLRRTNPCVFNILAFRCKCHPNSSV